MICIYHNRDLDGFTSAAIVKYKYPDCKLIGYDYGLAIPELPEREDIIMVDVSVPIEEMISIARKSSSFTWIDHHISAINEFNGYVGDIPTWLKAVLNNYASACEITWDYLFNTGGSPNTTPIPEAIRLLGEYDTWRNQDQIRWNTRILPFQFGMRETCNSPESFPIHLFKSEIEDIIEVIKQGRIIINYNTKINETQCKKNAFEIEFEGLRAICLNGGGFNSDVFKSVYDESKHDLMMPFQFNGNFWTVSLYATKNNVDCSLIAKSKGGGGHKKAAGFQVKDIKEVVKSIA